MEIKTSEEILMQDNISSKNKNNINEVNQLKEENNILKKESEDFKKEIISLKSNIFILEEKNKSLFQNNEILNIELNKKDNLIVSLNKERNNLSFEFNQLQKDNEANKADIKRKENEINENRNYKIEIENNLENIKKSIIKKEKQNSEYIKEITEKNNKIKSLQININNLNDNIINIKEENLLEKEKYNIEINKLQIELNETKEGKNLIIKEKEELDNEIKKINLINNKQAKEIGNQNGIIKQLNQKILNLSSTLKLKENEIQIEKNKNNKLNQLYTIESQKNIKCNNQLSFFQQIINDKENEIKNMRKTFTAFNNYKQIKGSNKENEEFKNKLIEENITLKEKAKEYNKLQLNYNELINKFNIISQNESQYKEMEKEYNKLIEENKKMLEENNEIKKMMEILNNQNKKLLYENTFKNNMNNMFGIINNHEKKDKNNYDNKYENYLCSNIDELNSKFNILINNDIDKETQIKKLNEEKEVLSKKIFEYDSTLKEMKEYIEQIESCNEKYRSYLQYYESEKNDIFKQNIVDRINNEKYLNENLTLPKNKSINSFYYKQSSLLMRDEEEDEENEKLEKENNELNKKLIENKNEIDNIKQKNSELKEEINKIINDKNNLYNENFQLKLNCDKYINEISILKEKINNLNSEIISKNEENESLSNQVSSMIKLSNERFEEAKNIMEKNIKEIKKENKDWRKGIDNFLGKKKEKDEDVFEKIEIKQNKCIDLDENREKEKEKYNMMKNEKIKLKMVIDNLRTENSLLKYKLLNFEQDKTNDMKNQNENNIMEIENENNNKINEENIQKLEELNNKIKENEEKIKKLQEENSQLKLGEISKNLDISSPYNFLMKELESLSKEKSKLEIQLQTINNEKKNEISKYANMSIECENIKNENNLLKAINKTLKNEIQKYKEEDIIKTKEEIVNLKNQMEKLEKEKNDLNKKYKTLGSDFNSYLSNSQKIRKILMFLIGEKKKSEENEQKNDKDKQDIKIKIEDLEKKIKEKDSKIEEKDRIIEEGEKKINEDLVKYAQLNNEYNNLLKLSKEERVEKNENESKNDLDIKKSFIELITLLNKYKEIIPNLYKKLENEEKENKNLKELINQMKKDSKTQSDGIVEDLKNQIKIISNENENLKKQTNIMKVENDIIKDDILLIGKTLSQKGENILDKKDKCEENSSNEILNQLIKAKNIISFLLNDKK